MPSLAFLPHYGYTALRLFTVAPSPFQQVAVVYWKESGQAVRRNLADALTTPSKFYPLGSPPFPLTAK